MVTTTACWAEHFAVRAASTVLIGTQTPVGALSTVGGRTGRLVHHNQLFQISIVFEELGAKGAHFDHGVQKRCRFIPSSLYSMVIP